ncbi:Hydroxyacylglutathione hydrolase [Roseovarius albus]|uniref:Hydroxyacylglutathione hydrolase n=1 Tax=Roseovarius albus TaxID=1247867 RepID=A0A1X6YXS1_9RHOB|nr:MBL fold metallo-hydrolase [Roseovarius albus]SLN34855.1 Hydroxyacylglutathione hydrolase [Roseovarius albus]
MSDKTEIANLHPGQVQDLSPTIRRILAPNPSPMTYTGTNTYILGTTDLAVIDPGPHDQVHLDTILKTVQLGQKITHILVSHSHLDHSPLAAKLSELTGAKIYAYGPSGTGRSQIMQHLIERGFPISGEGIDPVFAPDICLSDGESIAAQGWKITAHWTPGHLGNHLCFEYGSALFTGDLVMGWASSLVSPPDGDLTDFMSSCRKLETLNSTIYYPGHGDPISEPSKRLSWLISHRNSREREILQALKIGPASPPDLAQKIYTDTPDRLIPAATRNVLAHLIDLYMRKQVQPLSDLSPDTKFQLNFGTKSKK